MQDPGKRLQNPGCTPTLSLFRGCRKQGAPQCPASPESSGSWQGDEGYKLHLHAQPVKKRCRTQERRYRIQTAPHAQPGPEDAESRCRLFPAVPESAGQGDMRPGCPDNPVGAAPGQVGARPGLQPPAPGSPEAQDMERGC